MPNPTIRPFWAALFLVLMFASLVTMHVESLARFSLFGIMGFAAALIASIYGWLLTPLEDEH
jgi:hypothetical protein